MKKIYIAPELMVVRLTSKQALLQASFMKTEEEFNSSEMSYTREYDNTFPDKSVWEDEW